MSRDTAKKSDYLTPFDEKVEYIPVAISRVPGITLPVRYLEEHGYTVSWSPEAGQTYPRIGAYAVAALQQEPYQAPPAIS